MIGIDIKLKTGDVFIPVDRDIDIRNFIVFSICTRLNNYPIFIINLGFKFLRVVAYSPSNALLTQPIGEIVNIGWSEDDTENFEIIGVIKDFHFEGFDSKIAPMFLGLWNTFDFAKTWIPAIQFKIKGNNIDRTIAEIETFWKQNVDAKYPFSYKFLDDNFAESYEKYKKQQTMFLILSILVILISLLGLFALATLTIQQRLKEVAIRKTLGASVQEIMIQLLKNFLKVVVISSLILIPIAYYFMENWLENFVYRIDMPLFPYILTPIILILLVFVVVGLKAYSATKIDLIKYLKFE